MKDKLTRLIRWLYWTTKSFKDDPIFEHTVKETYWKVKVKDLENDPNSSTKN